MTPQNYLDRNRPILMLVTEPGPNLVDIVDAAVDGGVDIVQWRDKETSGAERREIARQVRSAIPSPALLVINDETDLAKAVDADGIQFPEAREIMPLGGLLIGRSVHSVDAARRAGDAGADYVVAGNIYETGSHPGRPAAGLNFLADVCRAVSIPVIAIGGITPANASDCLRVGAAGVAVLSTIMHAVDPRAAARSYRAALDEAFANTGSAVSE